MSGLLALVFSAVAALVGSKTGRPVSTPGAFTHRAPGRLPAVRAAVKRGSGEITGSRGLRVAVLVAAATVVALAAFVGVVAAAGIGVVAAAVLWTVASERRNRQIVRRGQSWHDALARLAAGLQTGVALPEALRGAADAAASRDSMVVAPKPTLASHAAYAAAEPARRLRAAAEFLDLGGAPDAAFEFGGLGPDPMAARLARCLGLCSALGVSPTSILAELAGSELAREQSRRDTRVALATARATSRLLALLPLGGVVLAATFGVSAPRVLFASFGGQLCLCAAGVFEAAGLIWVQRLAAAPAYG
jgi:tight adherence protein B